MNLLEERTAKKGDADLTDGAGEGGGVVVLGEPKDLFVGLGMNRRAAGAQLAA
jgi:hypothetical protein